MPDSRGKCTSFPSTQLRVFHCGCSHLQDTSSFPPFQPTSERCRLNVNDRCRFLEHLLSKTAVEINFVGSADLPCHSFNGCKQANTVKRDGLLRQWNSEQIFIYIFSCFKSKQEHNGDSLYSFFTL